MDQRSLRKKWLSQLGIPELQWYQDWIITELLSRFLRAKGFEKGVVNDPTMAVSLIKEEKYDAVLLDISMPMVSGIDIINSLEQEQLLKDQKIYILSAVTFAEDQIAGLLKKEGVKGCLKKPVALNHLLATITAGYCEDFIFKLFFWEGF